jgi:hypothetical protein
MFSVVIQARTVFNGEALNIDLDDSGAGGVLWKRCTLRVVFVARTMRCFNVDAVSLRVMIMF